MNQQTLKKKVNILVYYSLLTDCSVTIATGNIQQDFIYIHI